MTTTTVVDNTSVSGHVSVKQPVSHSSLSATQLPFVSQGISASDSPNNGVTSGEPSLTGAARSKPVLVDTPLSFFVAFRLKGDSNSLKRIVYR